MAKSIGSIDGVVSSLKILFPEQTKDLKLNDFVLEDAQGDPVYDSDLMIELSIAHYDKVLQMISTIAERLSSEDLPDLIDDQLLNSLLES
jgi:RNA binding exosome subunit